jgi:cytoskeletal protein RodZ
MTVGAQLAQARIAAGMSVAEVAAKVRLRNSLLTAIEADDFFPCGGEAYARGHVRSLAVLLGMDVDRVMADFALQVKPDENSLGELAAMSQSESRSLPWAPIMAAAAIVIAGVVGFSLFTGNGTSKTSPVATSASTSASVVPLSSEPRASSATAQITNDVVVVISAVNDSSWVAVTSDAGAQLFAGILSKGTSKEFHDPQHLRVVIGNAGAVTLSVNGKKLGTPGGPREVLHFDFGTGDPTLG